MTNRALSPAQYATRLGCNAGKVLTWIESGELAAIDIATKRGGRPRWKIPPEAIEAFEAGRRAVPPDPTPPRRRRKPDDAGIVEYV